MKVLGAQRSRRFGGLVAVAALMAMACGGGTSSSSLGITQPVTVGLLTSLTGKIAAFGQRTITGVQIAVDDINANGGISGQKLNLATGDDASDAIDAVPAMRQLMTQHLNYLLGPTSVTFDAIQAQVDSAKLVDFAMLASSKYDSLSDPTVWRYGVSDSVLGTAMAYYAIKQGYTKCAFMLENVESAQGFVDPITASYKAHGGQIVDNEQLTPHSNSYRTELTKAFANHPQCIFAQTDPVTSGTLFSNARELGYLSTAAWIGTDQFTDINVGKAIGLADAGKYITGMQGSSPVGPAFDYFKGKFAAKEPGKGDPSYFAAAVYDATILGALAMVAANSSDPNVWNSKIMTVSNPPGEACNTYATCVSMLKAGKKINYEGASGPMDFDAHHSVYTGQEVVKFDASGTIQLVMSIPAADLKGY